MNKNTLIATADLYDRYHNNKELQIVTPLLKHFGGHRHFSGAIRTLKVLDDNSFVRKMLSETSDGGVLVIDGQASMRCALLGDQIAEMAVKNGWAAVIINGCLRDCLAIGKMPLGVMALNSNPRKSVKQNIGEPDIPLMFADCCWCTGEYVYADADGVIISPNPLCL